MEVTTEVRHLYEEEDSNQDASSKYSGNHGAATSRGEWEVALRRGALAEQDWKLEADLRGVHRLIHSLKARPTPDRPASTIPAPHPPTLPSARRDEGTRSSPATEKQEVVGAGRVTPAHFAGWLILSLGVAILACGIVLLAWSVVTGREELWPLGMPLALIGQAGLVLGFVMQLDGLWATNRKTTAALQDLDHELRQVRHATSLLSASHSTASQSFYLHLAEGASPPLLLADLKGQLDLLGQQMARHKW